MTTFVLGLLTGTLVAMTNRIGGAIVAQRAVQRGGGRRDLAALTPERPGMR